MMYSHDGGWWWLMAITSTIFWLAILAGVIALVVWASRDTGRLGPARRPSARAILEERLARGEISPEEFQERLRLLTGGHPQ